MYCMDCLTKAVTDSGSSSGSDSSSSSSGSGYSSSYSGSSSSSSGSGSSGSSSGTTGSGGYDMPKEGESFSDYVKRVDPDLYNDMKGIYDGATG